MQLKESQSREDEMNATFTKASRDMESFKKSFNFRLNLEKSRVQILRKDHFTKFDAANIDIPTEVAELKALLESQDEEIKDLRLLVDNNPNLAERHARVHQLENQLKHQMSQSSDSAAMNKIIELSEEVMRALEDHKTNLAFLECEVAQGHVQSFQSQAEDGGEKMDIDQEMLIPTSI